MKTFLIVMFMCSSVFAARPKTKIAPKTPLYKIKMDLTIDGVKTSNTFVVKEGNKVVVKALTKTQAERFTEVTAKKYQLDGKTALQMEFVVSELDALGNKTVISTPKIVANLGERSSIMQGSTAVGKKLILSATATRVSKSSSGYKNVH